MKRPILVVTLIAIVVFAVACSQENSTPASTEAKEETKAETEAAPAGDKYYEVILPKFAEKLATKEQWDKFFNPEDIHKLAEMERSFYNPQEGDVIMLPANGKSFTHFGNAANADLVYAQVVVVKAVSEEEKAKLSEGVEVYMLKKMLDSANIYKVVSKP